VDDIRIPCIVWFHGDLPPDLSGFTDPIRIPFTLRAREREQSFIPADRYPTPSGAVTQGQSGPPLLTGEPPAIVLPPVRTFPSDPAKPPDPGFERQGKADTPPSGSGVNRYSSQTRDFRWSGMQEGPRPAQTMTFGHPTDAGTGGDRPAVSSLMHAWGMIRPTGPNRRGRAIIGRSVAAANSLMRFAQYAPVGPAPLPVPPVFLPGTPQNNDFVDSTTNAGRAIENAVGSIFNNQDQEDRDQPASGVTDHGQKRQDEAQSNPDRRVGDPNRVINQGRKYTDPTTGNSIYVDGNRVVVVDPRGNRVTQFKNSRRNTEARARSGKWIPN